MTSVVEPATATDYTAITTRLLDLACAIQQIPAPTFHEGARAAFVRDQFLELGLKDVEIDDLGNVYGRRPGGTAVNASRRPLLVTAHLDTVFPIETQLALARSPDRITGPGIGDNALGVAGLVALVWALAGARLPDDVWLAATVGEEGLGDLRGMRRVMDRFESVARATLVLEGMARGRIYHGAIPVRRYRISVQTEGGHSWLHFGQPSAVHTLVRLAARLTELAVPATPKTTFNIGTLHGGTSINTIAREATLDFDLRSEDPALLATLASQVEGLAAAFTAPGVRVQVEQIGNRPAGGIPREHPLVQAAARALQAGGLTAALEFGSTDANVPLSRGLPCVCLGLAHGGNAHRPDEFIEIGGIEDGLRALVATVLEALHWK